MVLKTPFFTKLSNELGDAFVRFNKSLFNTSIFPFDKSKKESNNSICFGAPFHSSNILFSAFESFLYKDSNSTIVWVFGKYRSTNDSFGKITPFSIRLFNNFPIVFLCVICWISINDN